MRDEKQLMRFTDPELSLMKGLFAGNNELLYLIRKVMLQFKLKESEEIALRQALNDKAYALVVKLFLPELDSEAPLFQLTDMHIGLQAELRLGPEQAWPYIMAKELEIAYIAQQLKALKGVEVSSPIVLKDMVKVTGKKSEKTWANLMARNYLISYIDSNIQQAKYLAGLKDESVEETKARLAKASNK